MEFYYDIQDGNYIWHRGSDDASNIGPEIAVLLDKDTGTLLKHGSPELVQEAYGRLARVFAEIDEQDSLVLLSGRVPLEKINHAISYSDTCHKVFENEIEQVTKYKSHLSA